MIPENDNGLVDIKVDNVFYTTTNDIINKIFGDLKGDYKLIIDRCDTNNWLIWKTVFEQWKANGFI